MQEDRLKKMFAKQLELIVTIAPVEGANSPLPTALDIYNRFREEPTERVLFDREVQLRIKESAWRFTEELSEVVEANLLMEPERVREEMVDCLHFLMELSIISNYKLAPKLSQDGDWLDMLFQDAENTQSRPLINEVIFRLGMCMHILKNRPWKKTTTELDVQDYHQRISVLWVAFIQLCSTVGLDQQSLFEGYFAKHQVNMDRQANGY
jgi:hypothetical protein